MSQGCVLAQIRGSRLPDGTYAPRPRVGRDSPSTVSFPELLSVPVKVLFHLLIFASLAFAGRDLSASDDRKGIAFFETKIRPVLVTHCYECHAPGADEIGGKLRLDSREGLRKGGESGPALVEGNPEESLIYQSLTWKHGDLQMPPEEPLSETVLADFAAWIEVWLDGAWHVFDPRNNTPRIGRILIATGRDAADVPLTHTFGPNILEGFRVWTDAIED